MTVYVESNFVLEIALGQEQSEAAEAILARAERGEVELAFPSFSLSEPFATVTQRSRNRASLSSNFNNHVRDLSRSLPHQPDIALLQPVEGVLVQISQRETDRLVSTVERLLGVAKIIPIDLPNTGKQCYFARATASLSRTRSSTRRS